MGYGTKNSCPVILEFFRYIFNESRPLLCFETVVSHSAYLGREQWREPDARKGFATGVDKLFERKSMKIFDS